MAAARAALEELAEDDSKRVSQAAAAALGADAPAPVVELAPPRPEPPRAPPAAPQRRRSTTAPALAVFLARAARWKNPLALAGAALLVLAYFRQASWDTSWKFATGFHESIWAVWSPVEAFGLAVLVGSAVLAITRGRLGREGIEGMFLGVAVVVCAGASSFATAYKAEGGFRLTMLGAAVLAGAGLLGLVTRRASDVALPRRAIMLAAAGVLLGLSPLAVNLADWESSLLDFKWRPIYLEVLAVGIVAAAAWLVLLRVPRARLHAAGFLVAAGVGLGLHVLGVLVQIAHDDGFGKLRLGGPLGIAGGLLLVAAGASVLRAQPRAEAPAALGVPAT